MYRLFYFKLKSGSSASFNLVLSFSNFMCFVFGISIHFIYIFYGLSIGVLIYQLFSFREIHKALQCPFYVYLELCTHRSENIFLLFPFQTFGALYYHLQATCSEMKLKTSRLNIVYPWVRREKKNIVKYARKAKYNHQKIRCVYSNKK